MSNKERFKRMRENTSECCAQDIEENDDVNTVHSVLTSKNYGNFADNHNKIGSINNNSYNNQKRNVERVQPLRKVYHYPSTLPFPTLLTDTFPAEPYRSRNKDVKSAIHWGQRKLLLSEIQLLSQYCTPQTSYHIIYAGSAPGTHLGFLDDMFSSRHTWELIDPGQFNRAVLQSRSNFTLHNEFFTNATAYGIVARCLHDVAPALGSIYSHLTIDALVKLETHKSMTEATAADDTLVHISSICENAKSNENNVSAIGVESEATHEVCTQTNPANSRERMSQVHAQLQHKLGTIDVARGTVDIPSMYEEPLHLPRGIELLYRATLEQRHKPLLFISDIRSGSVELSNFEEHVAENMRAQECWTNILHASYSMLKFRLPYTTKATEHNGQGEVIPSSLISEDGIVRYLRGDILLPIWTRPTSTEGRLVVPQGAWQTSYNVAHVENQFFFFNARVREQIHFNHILATDTQLDHHFDGAAEVECLRRYLLFEFPELQSDEIATSGELARRIRSLSEHITAHLKVSFADVIRRRESILLSYARQSGRSSKCDSDTTNNVSNDNEEHQKCIGSANNGAINSDHANGNSQEEPYRARHSKSNEWERFTRKMIHAAAVERERAIWKSNIDEQEHHTASGL